MSVLKYLEGNVSIIIYNHFSGSNIHKEGTIYARL